MVGWTHIPEKSGMDAATLRLGAKSVGKEPAPAAVVAPTGPPMQMMPKNPATWDVFEANFDIVTSFSSSGAQGGVDYEIDLATGYSAKE
jgi:hypothetical protein